jgi:hypothetical protein
VKNTILSLGLSITEIKELQQQNANDLLNLYNQSKNYLNSIKPIIDEETYSLLEHQTENIKSEYLFLSRISM